MPSSYSRIKLLTAERSRLKSRLAHLSASRQRSEPLAADFAEQAKEVENDEVVDQLEATTKAALEQLEHAIERLLQRQEDICEDCGQPMNAARIRVLPMATRCRECEESRASG